METLEDLKSTIAELKRAAADNGGQIAKLEEGETAIKDALQAIQTERAALHMAAKERDANGPDSEIIRSYVPRDVDTVAKHTVADARQPLSYTQNRSYYGNGDGMVKMLGSVVEGEWEPGLLDDPNPATPWQRRAQHLVDDIGLWKAITGRPATGVLARRLSRHLARGPEAVAKVFADNAGEGGEFVADIVVPRLLEELRAPVSLASNFSRTTTGTGGVTTNPFLSSGCQPFMISTPAAGDNNPADLEKSVPVTASRTSTPQTFAVNLPVFRDIEEDSIIEWGAFGRSMVVNALRDGEEDTLLNGDTGTHGDTGIGTWAGPNSRWGVTGSANDHRYGWVGLRHRGLSDASMNGDENAAQTVAATMLWRSNLAVAHKGLEGLMYILPISYIVAKLITDANVLTIDKYGPLATLLTGEIMRLGGIPVVTSEYMTEDLNASGVFDDVTTTQTGGLIVNRSRFEFVDRRAARVEMEPRPTQHTNYLVASVRQTFRTFDGASTSNLYYAFNLDKT